MARTSLPPGFRFHPTDVELVKYYLKRKVLGKKLCFDAIAEVNIYDFSPWDLPDKSFLRSGDLEWYFFSPKQKKYAKGVRTNRATESGYWKATGKDRVVLYNEVTAGLVKTLVFHLGHPPKGERTNWVMHEYSISDKGLLDAGVAQDSYVICKIFQKSGLGPKNGAQYGAPFCEKDWDLDDDEDAVSLPPDAPPPSANESVITTSAPGGSTTSSGPQAAAEEVPYSLDDALPLIDNHNHNHLVGNPNQFLDMVMEDNAVLPTTFVAPSFSGSTYAGGDVDERGPPGAPSLTDERQPSLSEDELDRLLGMFTDDIVVPGQGLFGMPCGFWDDGAGPSRVVVPSVDEVAPPPPGKADDDDNEINYLLGMFKEDDCSLENMFGNPFL